MDRQATPSVGFREGTDALIAALQVILHALRAAHPPPEVVGGPGTHPPIVIEGGSLYFLEQDSYNTAWGNGTLVLRPWAPPPPPPPATQRLPPPPPPPPPPEQQEQEQEQEQ